MHTTYSEKSSPCQNLCKFVILLSISVLISWNYNILAFKNIFPEWSAMKPIAAVALILAAMSIYLFKDAGDSPKKWVVSALSIGVVLTGLAALLEYF